MKNALPYYKRYPRDFIEGTIGFDLELKGAYAILLDLIYMQGGNLPDDDRYISGLMGCSAKKWQSIRARLFELGKITIENGKISNSRAVFELKSLRNFSETQSINASARKKNNDLQKPSLRQPEPEPEPIKKEPSVPKKGTRIPADFQPDLDEAVRLGVPPQMASTEAANFRDYWTAKAGKDATKLDWPATWRQWCRNAAKRMGARSSPAKSAFRQHQEDVNRSFEEVANAKRANRNHPTGEHAYDLDLEPTAFRRNRGA